MATEKGFCIDKVSQSDTGVVELINPATDEPSGVTATIYGLDSEKGRSATSEAQAAYIDISRKNRGKVTSEQSERIELKKILKITKSIDGLVDSKGVAITDVADIFSKVPAFYEQVKSDFLDRKLFIKA